MESNKIKNSIGVVRNPIGVIGLFLVLIEAIAALVIVNSSLSDLLNLILVLFIVVFPFVVLLVFYLLVTKHHEKLYSPSDYKDERYFARTYNSTTQTEEIVEVASQENAKNVSVKEGMTIEDIELIKESLNTIVSMQKSIAQTNKKADETVIVEDAERTINERLDSYVIEKETENKTTVTYINGSRQFVKNLNSKGYLAEVYFGENLEKPLLKKNCEHEAIWLGKKVPVSMAIEIIRNAKTKFHHLKYIDYSSEYAPSYIQYQIHIGGATSTALERNLKKLEIDDFEEIYKCQSEEELYKCITDLNRSE